MSVRTTHRMRRAIAWAAGILLVLSGCTLGAQSTGGGEEGYYDGATVEIIIPVAAGGGTDGQARLIANRLGDFLAGDQQINPVNITAGGGIGAANEFELGREADGLTLIMMTSSPLLPWILDDPGVEYDIAGWEPVWASPITHVSVHKADAGVTSVRDLANPAQPMILGETNPAGSILPGLLGLEAIGVFDSVQTIFGYEGGSSRDAAWEAGELNMNRMPIGTFLRTEKAAWDAGEIVPVFQYGLPTAERELTRDPALPDVPHIGEVYEELNGTEPSGPAWDAFMEFSQIVAAGGYSLWVHGDAPEEAKAELHEAISQMIEDSDYQAEKTALIGEADEVVGDDVIRWGQTFADLDADAVAFTKQFLSDHFDIDFD